MFHVYLLIGGNLGDRLRHIKIAAELIEQEIGELVKISSVYETAAWGNILQPEFYNQALIVKTALSPAEILKRITKIEEQTGRKRHEKWGARTMDVDIIFYGDLVIDENDLKIPHPFMQKRNFVLAPLVEIDEQFMHPILKRTIKELFLASADDLPVKKLEI